MTTINNDTSFSLSNPPSSAPTSFFAEPHDFIIVESDAVVEKSFPLAAFMIILMLSAAVIATGCFCLSNCQERLSRKMGEKKRRKAGRMLANVEGGTEDAIKKGHASAKLEALEEEDVTEEDDISATSRSDDDEDEEEGTWVEYRMANSTELRLLDDDETVATTKRGSTFSLESIPL